MLRETFAPRQRRPDIQCVDMAMNWIGLAAGIVREGIRDGQMRGNPQEVAEALMGSHVLYTMAYVLVGEPELDRKLARRVVRLMVGGCGRNQKKR